MITSSTAGGTKRGVDGAVKEERCDRCDVVSGLGCACPRDGSPARSPAPLTPHQEWHHFPADTILISPTRYAHRPGACGHLTEDLVAAPRWGWIPTPPPGLWDRLSPSHPATATAGNTTRQAIRRCESCQSSLP
ncbi:hypothetical protein ACWGIN_21255 [Streptomyces sp. NPDC054861]